MLVKLHLGSYFNAYKVPTTLYQTSMSKKSGLLYRQVVMFELPHKNGGVVLLSRDIQVFVARTNQWVIEKSSYPEYVWCS